MAPRSSHSNMLLAWLACLPLELLYIMFGFVRTTTLVHHLRMINKTFSQTTTAYLVRHPERHIHVFWGPQENKNRTYTNDIHIAGRAMTDKSWPFLKEFLERVPCLRPEFVKLHINISWTPKAEQQTINTTNFKILCRALKLADSAYIGLSSKNVGKVLRWSSRWARLVAKLQKCPQHQLAVCPSNWNWFNDTSLARCVGLKHMRLQNSPTIRRLDGLTNIRFLAIGNCPSVDLESLRQCCFLQDLCLRSLPQLQSLSFLESLPHMHCLEIGSCTAVEFDTLPVLPNVEKLVLGDLNITVGLATILGRLEGLATISLSNIEGVSDYSALCAVRNVYIQYLDDVCFLSERRETCQVMSSLCVNCCRKTQAWNLPSSVQQLKIRFSPLNVFRGLESVQDLNIAWCVSTDWKMATLTKLVKLTIYEVSMLEVLQEIHLKGLKYLTVRLRDVFDKNNILTETVLALADVDKHQTKIWVPIVVATSKIFFP